MLKKIEDLIESEDEIAVPVNCLEEFVSVCSKTGIGIIGFEGFKLENDGRTPLMEWIADFSKLSEDHETWESFHEASIESSRKFIEQIDIKDVYFVPSVKTEATWIKRVRYAP